MKKECVSIVLPTYNRVKLVKRAIESVLLQTYEEFELIIVDDGSVDDTEEMIRTIDDKRIRYIRLEKNSGPANARNVGIEAARYDYIAFHDSDDCWRRNKLEKQLGRLQQTSEKIGFVYGCYEYNSLDGKKGYFPRKELDEAEKTGNIYSHMLVENLVGMPTVLVKKKCIEKVGTFNLNYASLEDYEWLLRLSKIYEAEYLDEILVDVYATKGSVNQNLSANFSARCMLIGTYKEEMARVGVLDQVINEFLREAEYLGCVEQVLNGLEQALKM